MHVYWVVNYAGNKVLYYTLASQHVRLHMDLLKVSKSNLEWCIGTIVNQMDPEKSCGILKAKTRINNPQWHRQCDFQAHTKLLNLLM